MSIGSVFHHNVLKLCQGDTSIAVLLSKPWAAVVGMNGAQVGCWSGSTQSSRKTTATPWGSCAYIPPLSHGCAYFVLVAFLIIVKLQLI